MAETNNQIVKNASKAYGYNYASLADIVNQGFKLPKMTTRVIEGETFVFWYDEELKEWLQGAPLVVPEMKGMNAAQAMGSALTYARRYTAQMALGLACDDDAKLEKTQSSHVVIDHAGPLNTHKVYSKGIDFDKVKANVAEINNTEALEGYWKALNLTENQAKALTPVFSKRKKELGGE